MKLNNGRYEVSFVTKGGEILSFTDLESNIQYMWQGDEAYWTGKNPTLFPIVGNTFEKSYEIDGKTYAMKNHGLIRQNELTCIKQSENQIVFALDSNEDTLAQYPFAFHYEICYTLVDNQLKIEYTIKNNGNQDMPFSFGLHPGFNCPLCEGETYLDYKVEFEKEETCKQLVFDQSGQTPYHFENRNFKEWNCEYDFCKEYQTIIYKECKSDWVRLIGPKGHGVQLTLEDFPYFAIWTAKEGAPFVCLEPWYGHGDFSKQDVDFYHREDTKVLSAGEKFTTSYTISVF